MVDAVLPLPTIAVVRTHITTSQVRMYSNNLVWGGSLGPGDPNNYGMPFNQWVLVDARPWFEAAFATLGVGIFSSGIEIITNPNAGLTADVRCTFARPSDTTADINGYINQSVISGYGGVRSGLSTIIPVEGGFFKAAITGLANGSVPTQSYPATPAFGINLTPQQWMEGEQTQAIALRTASINKQKIKPLAKLQFGHHAPLGRPRPIHERA